jgi:hypothetical protein
MHVPGARAPSQQLLTERHAKPQRWMHRCGVIVSQYHLCATVVIRAPLRRIAAHCCGGWVGVQMQTRFLPVAKWNINKLITPPSLSLSLGFASRQQLSARAAAASA